MKMIWVRKDESESENDDDINYDKMCCRPEGGGFFSQEALSVSICVSTALLLRSGGALHLPPLTSVFTYILTFDAVMHLA